MIKTDWDFHHLYSSDEAFKKEFELLKEKVTQLQSSFSEILNNCTTFVTYLKKKIEVDRLIEKVYCYPKRHLDLDSSLKNYKLMLDEVLDLYGKIQIQTNDFEKKVIENDQLIKTYLKEEILKPYQRYLYLILRRKDHIAQTKDANYESDLNKIRQHYSSIVNGIQFEDVVLDGKTYTLNRNSYYDLILDEKQENRKKVYDTYTNAYVTCIDSLYECYLSKLKREMEVSKEERYPTLLSKKLYELELSDQIVENLLQEVNENLQIKKEYNELKQQILGLKEYHIYDNSLSICSIPKIEYSLVESIEIIKNALQILGQDYIQLIDKMFDEGWVDVYPKKKKRGMSFACISYSGVPYVLVNYHSSINDTRVLAHEIGHSLHTYYSKINNSFETFEFSLFLTEIASKVNEILVGEAMLKNCASKEEKIYILNSIISNSMNSLFGQTMLTEFEHSIIKKLDTKEVVTCADLNECYYRLSKKYNGNTFIDDEMIQYDWCKVPHFVMQDTYYVYQYAIGIAIATNLAYRILEKEEGIVEKYKQFLALGNRVSIKESLELLGIDLECGEYINSTTKVMHNKIEEMKELVKQKNK